MLTQNLHQTNMLVQFAQYRISFSQIQTGICLNDKIIHQPFLSVTLGTEHFQDLISLFLLKSKAP